MPFHIVTKTPRVLTLTAMALLVGCGWGKPKSGTTSGPDVNRDTDVDADTHTETCFNADVDTDTNTDSTHGGQLAWAKRAGGSYHDEGRSISSLSDGSTLATGSFQGTATFGLGELNETVLSSDGEADIFVAKFGP